MDENNIFFQKNQRFLLSFAHTEEGKYLLGIKYKESLVKITPNSLHFYLGKEKNKTWIKADFFSGDRVAWKLLPIVEKMERSFYDALKTRNDRLVQRYFENKQEAFLHYAGFRKSDYYPQIYLADFTGAGGEGRCQAGPGADWATTRNQVDPGSGSSMTQIYIITQSSNNVIGRGFFPTDTSSIGAGTTIESATWKGYRDDTILTFANPDSESAILVQTTQASASTLANEDYDNITFTSGGSFTFASTANNTYTSMTLNATGLTWINKTGNTFLGLIGTTDFDNTDTGNNNYLSWQTNADANPPTLTVVYASTGASGYKSLLGVGQG